MVVPKLSKLSSTVKFFFVLKIELNGAPLDANPGV